MEWQAVDADERGFGVPDTEGRRLVREVRAERERESERERGERRGRERVREVRGERERE